MCSSVSPDRLTPEQVFTGSIHELGELRKYHAQLRNAELLVIDDLFLRRLPANAGDKLADVLMSRYEKLSTVITSSRNVDNWPKLLNEAVVVTPLLDRVMHRGSLLWFDGKSCRLKEAAEPCPMSLKQRSRTATMKTSSSTASTYRTCSRQITHRVAVRPFRLRHISPITSTLSSFPSGSHRTHNRGATTL